MLVWNTLHGNTVQAPTGVRQVSDLMQQTGLLTRGFGNELRIRVTTPVTSSLVGHIKLCCDSLLLHIPLQTLETPNLGS